MYRISIIIITTWQLTRALDSEQPRFADDEARSQVILTILVMPDIRLLTPAKSSEIIALRQSSNEKRFDHQKNSESPLNTPKP